MNVLGFAALLALTVGWVILPLLPALREYFAPTDVEPLTMVGRDNADISRFARNFRDYLKAQLEAVPPEPGGGDQTGKLQDGTPFVRLVRAPNEMTRSQVPPSAASRLVISDQNLVLDGGEQFRLELWAREDFIGGPGATYRAILGERNIELGEKSVTLRWLHSVDTLVVGPDSHLFGRTSSDRTIRLATGVGFDRLGAPEITTGQATLRSLPPTPPDLSALLPPPESRTLGDHLRIEGDFRIPPACRLEGNLVVAGKLTIGRGARVAGSVKAHGEVILEEGAVVEGALVSQSGVSLVRDCWVRGPLISEGHLMLGRGTSVGTRLEPTTVSARTVSLDQEVAVAGHVVAELGGQTVA